MLCIFEFVSHLFRSKLSTIDNSVKLAKITFHFKKLGKPASLGVPEAATMRLYDGKWVANDKQSIFNYICSEPLGKTCTFN